MGDSSAGPIRVLHVDDEPGFAEMAARFLEREDDRFVVETAASVDDARDRLAGGEFDCVVSDYDMPDRNGIEFLEAVREDHPDLPFILFTGKGSEEVAGEAIAEGVTDYLRKGSDTGQYELLANRVRNAVRQYRADQRAANLERVRAIVNDINQALVRASSRREVETEACEILAGAEPYRFATVAEVEPETERITPRAWAGAGEAFLDGFGMTVAEGAPGRRAPGGRAYHERELAVAQDLQTDPAYEPWRDLALEHGFRALAVVPLEHDDEFYGLLAVFADRPHAFDETERELLVELGDDIAHAIHTREVRDELRQSQRRFEAIFEDPKMLVGVLDTDGTLLHTNRTSMEFVEAGRDDVVGEPFWETPWWDEGIRDDVREWVERAAAGEYVEYEADLARPDGERYSVSGTVRPVTDTGGEVASLVVSARDITERKERQRELVRERDRFESLFETLPEPVALISGEERVESTIDRVNAAFEDVFGYEEAEVVGEHLNDVVVPEEKLDEARQIDQRSVDRELPPTEVRRRTADGDLRDFLLMTTHLAEFGEDDLAEGFAIYADITEQKETQRELERQRTRFETLFRALPEPTAILSGDEGPFVKDVNPAFEDVFGYDADAVRGEDLNDLIVPPEYRDEARRVDDSAIEGDVLKREVERETADGDRRDFLMLATGEVETDSGELSEGYVIYADITARKERERELARERDRYTTLFENLPNPVVHGVMRDGDAVVREVNAAFEDTFGLDAEAITGDPLHDYIVPGDGADLRALNRQLLEEGELHTEVRREAADGLRDFRVDVVMQDLDTDTPQGYAIHTDITERKERERELEQYETIVETIPEGIFVLDEEGVIVSANGTAAEMVGRELDDLLDEPFQHLIEAGVFEEGVVETYTDHVQAMLSPETDRDQARYEQPVTVDGEERIYETHLALRPFEDEFRGTVGVLRDITDQRHRQRELERQNERLEEFASVVSHDLRNPLNVAEGRLELARADCESDHLDDAARALDRMDALIDDLLTLSREGDRVSEVEPVDLAALAGECWENVDTAGASLVAETDRTLRADPGRLKQLLENLVRNAVEHSSTSPHPEGEDAVEHGGGDVTVRVGDLDDGTGFYVEDDGPGIPEDERDRVFESGYSTSEGSTGFGLSIVEEIAEAHDWEVAVTGGESGGARFEVTGVEFLR